MEILQEYAQQQPQGKSRKIIMRFLVSPVEIIGTDKVEAIKIVKNELYTTERGDLRPRPTEQFETIPVGLVFRSVGYRGVPLPDVPFYDKWGTIPNEKGRILTDLKGEQVIGEYVVGWIKRGPSGMIGTNKPDSVETVEMLLEDRQADKLFTPSDTDPAAIETLLQARNIEYVTYDDWLIIDALEQQRGAAVDRPRLKFCRVQDMLDALREAQTERMSHAGD